jgi:hypothetical protein
MISLPIAIMQAGITIYPPLAPISSFGPTKLPAGLGSDIADHLFTTTLCFIAGWPKATIGLPV